MAKICPICGSLMTYHYDKTIDPQTHEAVIDADGALLVQVFICPNKCTLPNGNYWAELYTTEGDFVASIDWTRYGR